MIVPFFTNFSGNDDIKKNPECMSYIITYNDFARASSFLLTFSTLLLPCFHFPRLFILFKNRFIFLCFFLDRFKLNLPSQNYMVITNKDYNLSPKCEVNAASKTGIYDKGAARKHPQDALLFKRFIRRFEYYGY
jgi:hypothetical protein